MTLFDLMPTLWLLLAFVLLCVYFLSGHRVFLYGCGGAFFALCPAVLCLRIFVQTAFFFIYMISVLAASRISSHRKKHRYAVALTRIDSKGGYILCGGKVKSAYTRDRYAVYRTGDVFETVLCSDGTVRVDRV